MKKSFKKITALVLAFAMVFSSNLFANFAGASNTIDTVTITPNTFAIELTNDFKESEDPYAYSDSSEYICITPDNKELVLYINDECEEPVQDGVPIEYGNKYYYYMEFEAVSPYVFPATPNSLNVEVNNLGRTVAPTVFKKWYTIDNKLAVVLEYSTIRSVYYELGVYNPLFTSNDSPSSFNYSTSGDFDGKDFSTKAFIRYIDAESYEEGINPIEMAIESVTWYSDEYFEEEVGLSDKLTNEKYYLEVVAKYDDTNLTGDDLQEYNTYLDYNFKRENAYAYINAGNQWAVELKKGAYKVSTKINQSAHTITYQYELYNQDYPRISKVELIDYDEEMVKLRITGSKLVEMGGIALKDDSITCMDDIFSGLSSAPIGMETECVGDSTSQEMTILACEPLEHKFEDDTTYNLWLMFNDEDNYYHINYLTSFVTTLGNTPQPSHTTKKYTAKNVNTSAEKISGTGKKGSTRTITPKEGKKVASVVVTDKQGNKIDVTMNEDGTYSFIQPASAVNVEVNYKNREIKLTIGSTDAYVDEELNSLDVCPVIRNDRTMLPIRFVAENLGAKVEWNEKNPNYVLITKGDTKIEITLGSDKMLVNGKEVKLDSVAFAENDRTYLPVRAVSENLNAIVEWNEAKPMEVKIYER